jgi:hypothetical protein
VVDLEIHVIDDVAFGQRLLDFRGPERALHENKAAHG